MTIVRANAVEVPPSAIAIVIQHYAGDEERAMRLARLIADIEPTFRDDVVLVLARRYDVPATQLAWDTALYCGQKFSVMQVRSKREATGHPDGSFAVFAGTMDALADMWASGRLRAHSALMIEADGVPLRATWLDDLIGEHRRSLEAGKRITGPEMVESTRHINGSMLVHFAAWLDHPSLHRCPPGQAWDLFHAVTIMAEARPTTLIKNLYGRGNYSDETLRALKKETAYLSSSKDDTALVWAERTLPRRVRKTEEARHYVTVCKRDQLPVLLESMRRHCGRFKLHALCWDYAYDRPGADDFEWIGRDLFLERHPCVLPLPGPPRNSNETVCTVRWRFACDVMEDTGQPVTIIDGDMMFFSSPELVFEEIGDAPCAVSPHNFAFEAEQLPGVTVESHGKFSLYNGGWSYWADRTALERMRKTTDEWCYQGFRTMPDGRVFFGDQGPLELIVKEHGAHVIKHRGVNLGPWSRNMRKLSVMDDGTILANGHPVVSVHYQSLKFVDGKVTQLADPGYGVSEREIEILYRPYLAELGVEP